MAHIHLPDGVLPITWVAFYWLISLALLGIVAFYFRRTGKSIEVKTLSVAGVATALAFVIFQVEVPVLGGLHLNFTPMLGILVGPIIGSVSAVIINILSSAVGHGGWGPIGLNFLINMVEIVVAFSIFVFLFRRRRVLPFIAALVATLIALTVSNALMVGAITVSGIQGVEGVEELQNLLLLALINEVAAVVESIVTGFLVAFLAKVKPELLGGSKIEES
ncbi:MAG: cobalamin biosynthesis protein CobM [Candidatus Verstraetearchaeota archaeon]|nr:cobalamin biosynthesis protein CobM [Candidatus Verstraetearchaeota archaeon]